MNMKALAKVLPILLAAFAVIALVACSSDPAPAPEPTAAVVAIATAEPTQAPAPPPTPIPTATSEPTPTPEPVATAEPISTPAPAPTATPIPTPTVVPYPAVAGIVDVSNRGWPREVETQDGVIRLEEPPQRVLSYSLGHDEILLALLTTDRIAAVGPFTADPVYSNVADVAAGLPTYEKGVESVLAANPDLVVVSKFTDADIVDLLQEAGVQVVRPALESSAEGNLPTILLLGYMLGVEERALELVEDIRSRLELVGERVPPVGDEDRLSMISVARYSDLIYVAGSGSTEGGIIEAAGGTNAAARDGIEGHKTVSIESIAAMDPDVIIVTQPAEYGAGEFLQDLLDHPALTGVQAVADEMVMTVDQTIYTTLSHWNVRGIEETALLLYPDRFADITFTDFEPYAGE